MVYYHKKLSKSSQLCLKVENLLTWKVKDAWDMSKAEFTFNGSKTLGLKHAQVHSHWRKKEKLVYHFKSEKKKKN